jgi:hypothetical protein
MTEIKFLGERGNAISEGSDSRAYWSGLVLGLSRRAIVTSNHGR